MSVCSFVLKRMQIHRYKEIILFSLYYRDVPSYECMYVPLFFLVGFRRSDVGRDEGEGTRA